MIDSIIASFEPSPLRDGVLADLQSISPNTHPCWRANNGVSRTFNKQTTHRFYYRKSIGSRSALTVFGNATQVDGFKVSLPARLHGTNSSLLTSQREVDQTLALIENDIREIADISILDSGLWFTRVDLTLQFNPPSISPPAFFRALRSCRTPLIRNRPEEWTVRDRPSGITFKGTNTTIAAYDKRLKEVDRLGDVTRIEIRLRKESLKRLLGPSSDRWPTRLDFDRCYSVYRDIMLQFPAPKDFTDPPPKSSRDAFVYLLSNWEHSDALLPNGRRPLEWLEECFSSPTMSRFRKDVAASHMHIANIDFAELLPPSWPPRHLAPAALTPAEMKELGLEPSR